MVFQPIIETLNLTKIKLVRHKKINNYLSEKMLCGMHMS